MAHHDGPRECSFQSSCLRAGHVAIGSQALRVRLAFFQRFDVGRTRDIGQPFAVNSRRLVAPSRNLPRRSRSSPCTSPHSRLLEVLDDTGLPIGCATLRPSRPTGRSHPKLRYGLSSRPHTLDRHRCAPERAVAPRVLWQSPQGVIS